MKNMKKVLVIVTTGLIVGACSGPASLSPNWGAAYQNMRAKQVLNPTAGEQLDPVEGQDGKVNATVMDTYRKGFEKPDAEFNRSVITSGVQTK